MLLLTPEDQIIVSCIKIHPTPEELEQIDKLILQVQDWNYLITTIIDRGIGPLLYKKLPLLTNSSQMPEAVRTKLQQAYYRTFSRSTILYEHFRKIAEAFTSQDIQIIALKGVYLSERLYQDIGLRQFSDIDLLVKEDDASSCLAILAEMGYKPDTNGKLSRIILSQLNRDFVHYPPMIGYGVSIEIHIKLHQDKEKYKVKVDELWKNAIPATVNGVQVSALHIYDLLIHLCLHLDKHFKVGHVQFTCFNDITNLLERVSGTIDWNAFTEVCQIYNCENIVFKYIVMTHNYMHATVPIEIILKYGVLLDETDEQLFFKYLKDGKINMISSATLSGHFGNIMRVDNSMDKVKYLWGVVFPSKAFMIQRYEIKHRYQVLFYYPYRYYIGIMGVVNRIFKK